MDLTRLTTEATLVGARAYAELPKALADDVATDVAGASAVPEERKKSFLPGAGGDARRANEIAAQWVDKVLAPEKGQRIGVLIFWHSGETEASAGPIFVLIRGETDDDGVLRVTGVVYGNPLRSEQ